jgi:hypothetical protein
MTTALEQLNHAVDDLVAAHGGVRPVEQGEGDSFVVAFARASDAVACALQLQLAVLPQACSDRIFTCCATAPNHTTALAFGRQRRTQPAATCP